MNPTNPDAIDGYVAAIQVLEIAGQTKAVTTLMDSLSEIIYLHSTKQGPYEKHAHTVEYQRQGDQM